MKIYFYGKRFSIYWTFNEIGVQGKIVSKFEQCHTCSAILFAINWHQDLSSVQSNKNLLQMSMFAIQECVILLLWRRKVYCVAKKLNFESLKAWSIMFIIFCCYRIKTKENEQSAICSSNRGNKKCLAKYFSTKCSYMYYHLLIVKVGHAITYLVEALCYKPTGRGIESRWGGFFQST
jgi:hypothetical protein